MESTLKSSGLTDKNLGTGNHVSGDTQECPRRLIAHGLPLPHVTREGARASTRVDRLCIARFCSRTTLSPLQLLYSRCTQHERQCQYWTNTIQASLGQARTAPDLKSRRVQRPSQAYHESAGLSRERPACWQFETHQCPEGIGVVLPPNCHQCFRDHSRATAEVPLAYDAITFCAAPGFTWSRYQRPFGPAGLP